MSLTAQAKKEAIQSYQRSAQDTGSPEVQIALLTTKINTLTQHLQTHKKDNSSRRGLLRMVSQRRKLLDYLKATQIELYRKILGQLGLRR